MGRTPKRGTPKKRTVTDISLTLTVPPVTGTEREALEALYHATDGPNWTSKVRTGWTTTRIWVTGTGSQRIRTARSLD